MPKLMADIANKINLIQQQTQQDISEILKKAIELYYQTLQIPQKTPLQILEESGLIGCFEDDPDLSSNYKQVLTESLAKKYDHR
ncbi:conserved hypothetical protein (plasmid) [Picosynechococcus sp. PCC 7002]|nr:conserved hypothetical protein [Picosynechococcus sp. PCC 7002]